MLKEYLDGLLTVGYTKEEVFDELRTHKDVSGFVEWASKEIRDLTSFREYENDHTHWSERVA